ncbi:MAG TPA: glucose-1-phosphate thymidylyltransferase [Acidobacteria bacterium]|nr:glucose-1-phosphate thymidylyltransferase [Acidobacteriota bacterium]
MKGLILSGGKGTRLRPLTYTSAKQLVPVANKPVLFYGIEALAAAGIHTIGIVVGDTKKEIRAAVGDGSAWNVDITYIEQDAPRGLAHAVLISQSFIGDDPFIVYLGDNLLAKGIVPFVEHFVDAQPAAQILLAHVSDPKRFGVAEIAADGRVKKVVEKPAEARSDLALVGVYMFTPEVFQAIREISLSPRNELEITDAIQKLVDNGLTVTSHIVDGWWKDTGKLEDILEANRLILETMERRVDGEVDSDSRIDGNVIIEPGASIKQSKVQGPAIIGADARISSAYIGPFTSIMNNVRVHDSEIEHSIVLEGSDLRALQCRMTDSLIGKNVKIFRDPGTPSTYRFMLGDNSEVGIPW